MYFFKKWLQHRQAGFSLVELMVVVAIIGILAALAVPRFRNFQAKARQAEAKNNLMNIATLQEAYRADHDEYRGFQNYGGKHGKCDIDTGIGFILTPCDKARYTYSVEITNGGGGFRAVARSNTGGENLILPGCNNADEWSIDHEKRLEAVSDVTLRCDQ